MAFISFKILQNNFVHHIHIQIKTNQVLLNKFQYLYKKMSIVMITIFQLAYVKSTLVHQTMNRPKDARWKAT
jgi:hypothetical protein